LKLEKDSRHVIGAHIAVNFNLDAVGQISAQREPQRYLYCAMQIRGRRARWPAYRIESDVNRRA
jgi:hypothetical protein